MTTAEKVIKTKVGLLELGKQLGKCIESVPSDGLELRQFLLVQGSPRDRRRSSTPRDIAEQTEFKELDR